MTAWKAVLDWFIMVTVFLVLMNAINSCGLLITPTI